MGFRDFFLGADRARGAAAPVRRINVPRPEGRRHYLLGAPGAAAARKRPLVIVLHGSGASAEQVMGLAFPPSPLSVWREIAQREQLLVVAPDGIKRRGRRAWNDGFATIASNPDVDDVGFIGSIIDQCVAEHDADPARVYVIGVSKGGMMAYRLAVELAPRLAAFAAVLAGMPHDRAYAAPSAPLSAMVVGGTSDPFIPYQGGKKLLTLHYMAPMVGIEQTAACWRELAGLPALPHSVAEFPRCDGATKVTRSIWGKDPCSLQVALLTIHGGGHAEPSASKRYPGLFSRLPGRQNGDLEIAEEAWAFFKDKTCTLT